MSGVKREYVRTCPRNTQHVLRPYTIRTFWHLTTDRYLHNN